ncbi:MAG: flavin monoamine oxidase family protein, partial [Arenibacterium sp.]
GCSWISKSDTNPFSAIARDGGFTLVDHTDADTSLFDQTGARLGEDQVDIYEDTGDALGDALEAAAEKGIDAPAIDHIPKGLPYAGAAQSWMGPMDFGVDFKDLSTQDYWNTTESQPSYIVREGLGAVVATLAQDLPISLNTKVDHIDWSGPGVIVHTTNGTLRAKSCILTVSTGVLQSGSIRFTPALPDWKQQAFHDIPMGLLMKVPMLFDGARLDLPENNWVTYDIPESDAGKACYFVAWPCGHDYLFGNIGGQFAWDLWSEGSDAVVDYALEQLVRITGSNPRKHFVKGFATDWASNPLTHGAYGATRPGAFDAREKLAEPLADTLFFAGEAVMEDISALVNGAFVSGLETANDMAKCLKRQS